MSRSACLASCLIAVGSLPLAIGAQEAESTGYEYKCEEISGNPRRAESICVGFEFTDGTNDVSAGRATTSGLDSEGNLWSLTESVRLTSGTTEIVADDARLQLEAGELVLGELNGDPVLISDYIEESGERVSGAAQGLTYDNRSGEVHLIGQVTLAIGENEFTGCSWFYNAIDKSYRSGAADECDDGFRMLLAPPEDSDEQERPPTLP